MENKKSDIQAKNAFVQVLNNRGFTARIVKAPADIIAEKDGQTWYFEIKMTTHADKYFGAATMTEWGQALSDSDHFRFVVAIDLGRGKWEFKEYTPAEFMAFSSIPPFKVYFNIHFDEKPKKRSRESKAVKMSEDNFYKLSKAFGSLSRG